MTESLPNYDNWKTQAPEEPEPVTRNATECNVEVLRRYAGDIGMMSCAPALPDCHVTALKMLIAAHRGSEAAGYPDLPNSLDAVREIAAQEMVLDTDAARDDEAAYARTFVVCLRTFLDEAPVCITLTEEEEDQP